MKRSAAPPRWRDGVYRAGSGEVAVIILHEIYGVNDHITETAARLAASGMTAYCPDLLGTVYGYDREEDAYARYMAQSGFPAAGRRVNELAGSLAGRHRRIYLLGYSAGATVAWLCSAGGGYAGIVGYYGSRIRDYEDVTPDCPVLLIFSRSERSFAVEAAGRLGAKGGVTVEVVGADHGFADRHSPRYDEAAAAAAWRRTAAFCGWRC